MRKVQVLVDDGNRVLGTFSAGAQDGEGAPAQVGFRAGPGQRVVEVELADSVLELDPDSLHQRIEADNLG
jgi:hypothetical protein